jgi:hypothetical protein
MSADASARIKRVAEWRFQDTLGYSGMLPNGNYALVYIQTIMDVAAY